MEELFAHRVMLGKQGEIAVPTVEFNLIFQLRILLFLKPCASWFRLHNGVLEICRLNRRIQLLYISVFYEEEKK